MEPLSRTVSAESARSQRRCSTNHVLSAGTGQSPTSRKARSSEPETSGGSNERASISMPPPASKTIRHSLTASRRPSRSSDVHAGLFAESVGAARNAAAAAAFDETDTTPAPEGPRPGGVATTQAETLSLPDSTFYQRARTEGDKDLNRMSFSSLYSLSSVIMNSTRGLSGPSSIAGSEPEAARAEGAAQAPTTATSSVSVTTTTTTSPANGLNVSPTQLLHPKDQITPTGVNPPIGPMASPPPAQPTTPNALNGQKPQRSRSRNRATARRISGSAGVSSSPAGSREEKKPTKGIIGVCALESKARSKPARNIFGKLVDDFEVKIFGDKIILDEDVENWPVCDFLISFFSDGFPLDKAIAYARLRKPFCVNDLPMQQVLWDRRLCLQILDKLNVPTPKRIEVTRDGGPKVSNPEFAKALYERTGVRLQGGDGIGGGVQPPKKVEMIDNGNTLFVDGKTLTKPFVEKPVSGEDHNINVYYHSEEGGGGRRLFRKVNNKSSAKDDTLHIPRSITEPTSSYVYEQFLKVENSEDVKAYTVGPNFCHAETRKSPVVDGLVKRNPSGKEVRYVTKLTDEEAAMASRISEGFGQKVCGFDLLRTGERSYVIDVNGWSFVKDNMDYYDTAAKLLREMFEKEIARKERKDSQAVVTDAAESVERPNGGLSRKNTSSHRETLSRMLKSPSMTKLGHAHIPHPHIRSSRSSAVQSPETSLSTSPSAVSPKLERSGITSAPPTALKSEPDLLAPASARDNNEGDVSGLRSEEDAKPVPPPASKAQWKLKGVVSVIRHADRTPKQKFKYTFHSEPFVKLLRGHVEEVLLIGEGALQSVSDAVKVAMEEGIEDPKKLRELQIYLDKKGSWPGTKVQIKPMFRKRRKEELLPGQTLEETPESAKAETPTTDEAPDGDVPKGQKRSDSMSGVTLSRIAAAENNLILDKLQLIIKWGGEPTHSARHQSQDMAANFRNDLKLMNREVLEDVSIFSSSERRVTTSAQIFGSTFLDDKSFDAANIHIRKDLLDDSNAAKDVMDKVKKKLKTLLRAGDKAPPQFVWPKDVPEPYIVVRQVVELMKFHHRVMKHNYKKLESGAVSSLNSVAAAAGDPASGSHATSASTKPTSVSQIQGRWCCNEGPELFKERWEKLFKEFADADKVDPSKISELYDSMKFDALHNRQFLEWVFTPDATFLDEDAVADNKSTNSAEVKPKSESQEQKEQPQQRSREERGSMVHRMGFRRRSEVAVRSAPTPAYPHESYFKLFTGSTSATKENGSDSTVSRAQSDARLAKLRDMYHLCKVLFDYIGPQEYGITNEEKLEIGLLTSLPLLKEIVEDLEELQASDAPKSFFYFTKESHIYTLLNCILEGGIKTKIERNAIPELDYLSQIGFELYESENVKLDGTPNTFNYSIRITLSPGCHAFAPLDVQLDSRHMIGFSPRRSLTAHHPWREVLETLRAKFNTVKLPKSFVAVNLSEKVPGAFGVKRDDVGDEVHDDQNRIEHDSDKGDHSFSQNQYIGGEQPSALPSPAIEVAERQIL